MAIRVEPSRGPAEDKGRAILALAARHVEAYLGRVARVDQAIVSAPFPFDPEPFDARAVFSLLMRLVQQFSEAAVQSRGGQLATEQQARLMEQQLAQLRAVKGQVMQEQLARELALAQRDTTIHELERQLAISRQASRAPSEYASPARGGAQEDWDEE